MLADLCVNRIGQTTLEQLIEELRECRLLLTNDTGTMHLAALLNIPTVAIFGSTEPKLTGPPDTRTHRLAPSCRMRSLFFARMPDRFSLHESDQRRGSA